MAQGESTVRKVGRAASKRLKDVRYETEQAVKKAVEPWEIDYRAVTKGIWRKAADALGGRVISYKRNGKYRRKGTGRKQDV